MRRRVVLICFRKTLKAKEGYFGRGGGVAAARGKYVVYISEVCEVQGKFALRPARSGGRCWLLLLQGRRRLPPAPRFAINARFVSVYIVVSCFGCEQRKGRSRNSLRGSYLLPSVFFVVIFSGEASWGHVCL